MFTIKLQTKENGAESTTNYLCCNNYSVLEGTTYCEITVYNDYTTQKGTTYSLSKDGSSNTHFTGYVVTNQIGKIVDSF
jgi:hypothetical protein